MISDVTHLMLTVNNEANWDENGLISEPKRGVTLHKIDALTAAEIATKLLPRKLFHPRLPLTYILACIGIESLFDPNADNGNLGPDESNPENDPLGYDVGLCQHKLRYLIGRPGISDAATARTAALNIDWAIEAFLEKMEGLYDWAHSLMNDPSLPDRAHSVFWLATTGYNFGTTGALTKLRSNAIPHMDKNASHGDHVARYEVRFAQMIKQPSVMEDVVTQEESS